MLRNRIMVFTALLAIANCQSPEENSATNFETEFVGGYAPTQPVFECEQEYVVTPLLEDSYRNLYDLEFNLVYKYVDSVNYVSSDGTKYQRLDDKMRESETGQIADYLASSPYKLDSVPGARFWSKESGDLVFERVYEDQNIYLYYGEQCDVSSGCSVILNDDAAFYSDNLDLSFPIFNEDVMNSTVNIPSEASLLSHSLLIKNDNGILDEFFSYSNVLASILQNEDPSQQLNFNRRIHDIFLTPEDNGSCIDNTPFTEDCGRTSDFNEGNRQLSQFQPVALVNRIDLASETTCGEMRYVVQSNTSNLLIFEAEIPNPGSSIDDCQPLIQFWASLANETLTTEDRLELLRTYYFDGISDDFGPVFRWQNYQTGQIRHNHLSGSDMGFSWQFTESTLFEENNEIHVQRVPVEANPHIDLFRHDMINVENEDLQFSFLEDFREEIPGLQTDNPMHIAMNMPAIYNAPQSSVSFGGPGLDSYYGLLNEPDDTPRTTTFHPDLFTEHEELGELNQTHILRRASVNTCAFCHQPGSQRDLGNGMMWPTTLGFRHLMKSGNVVQVSPALTDLFLPARVQFLREHIQTTECAETYHACSAERCSHFGLLDGEECLIAFCGEELAREDSGICQQVICEMDYDQCGVSSTGRVFNEGPGPLNYSEWRQIPIEQWPLHRIPIDYKTISREEALQYLSVYHTHLEPAMSYKQHKTIKYNIALALNIAVGNCWNQCDPEKTNRHSLSEYLKSMDKYRPKDSAGLPVEYERPFDWVDDASNQFYFNRLRTYNSGSDSACGYGGGDIDDILGQGYGAANTADQKTEDSNNLQNFAH